MLLISAHILDPFWRSQLFRKWGKEMDINPKDETSYTTQYQEAFLKYVENEYSAKHRCLPVSTPKSIPNNNLVSSGMASRSGQSFSDQYYSSSDDEECLIPNNVAETTPGQSDHTACLLTATRLHLNSPPEVPQNWGQIRPNINDYHSDPMESSHKFSLPNITDWWGQQEEMRAK